MVSVGRIKNEGDILQHQSKNPFQTKGMDEIDRAVQVVVSQHTSLMNITIIKFNAPSNSYD